MRTIKDLLKKVGNNNCSFKSKLAQVLMYQRSVPHSSTQTAPSILLNNRKYINARDRVHPKLCHSKVKNIPATQMRQFEIGDILALNIREGPKWLKARITDRLGNNVYHVCVYDSDIIWKRRWNQLCEIIKSD